MDERQSASSTSSTGETTTEGSSSSPTKQGVSHLIESRHEWLREAEELRKRQSIRDEDLPRSIANNLSFDEDLTPTRRTARKADVSSSQIALQTPDLTTCNVAVQDLATRFAKGDLSSSSSPADEELLSTDSIDPVVIDPALWMTPNTTDSASLLMDLSLDSLDRGNREHWGNARRHKHFGVHLERSGSEATMQVDNTTSNASGAVDSSQSPQSTKRQPLAKIQVADSLFLGYARCGISHQSQVMDFVSQLRLEHPRAAHVPFAFFIPAASKDGYEEDGEPPLSTGPFLLNELKDSLEHQGEGVWLFPEEAGGVCGNDTNISGTCVAIVRFFGKQLLGVTAGRLSQCYQRIAQMTLHRLFRGTHIPLQLDFTTDAPELPGTPAGNIYGLAGGDTELHLNILKGDKNTLMNTLLDDLDFEGFKGAKGEFLPRLQNLQADFYEYDKETQSPVVTSAGTIFPIYRYPGNYQGDEWETFPWSPLSLEIKEKVETALPQFYGNQKMKQFNHCVTNLYRDGDDYIAHHSDKDLDLDSSAAIVSVSVGAERILELRRRAEPRDLTRLVLPHGSMLLLGPVTNQYFTHSILPVERDIPLHPIPPPVEGADDAYQLDNNARISLTLRNVTTYMDTKTQGKFGEGVNTPTLQALRRAQRWDSLYFLLGFSALQNVLRQEQFLPTTLERVVRRMPWSMLNSFGISSQARSARDRVSPTALQSLVEESLVVLGSAGLAWISYGWLRRLYLKRKEEHAARQFFTSKSTSGTKY